LLPHETGAELSIVSLTKIEEPIDKLDYKISFQQSDAVVDSENGRWELKPGEKMKMEFDPVEVRVFKLGDKLVQKQNPRDPDETIMARVGDDVVSVTVTPTLLVKHHGKLRINTPEQTLWEMAE
jgi:tRNA U54 and U55 pseudouridine synthase Pus10